MDTRNMDEIFSNRYTAMQFCCRNIKTCSPGYEQLFFGKMGKDRYLTPT